MANKKKRLILDLAILAILLGVEYLAISAGAGSLLPSCWPGIAKIDFFLLAMLTGFFVAMISVIWEK